ncbi:MAG: Na/Pi cotransporter family protein, partial [Gemmatimonadetes bacterium]|nr:Na/Pi cotransporter family protein [Gemmatimonadota bacterium]
IEDEVQISQATREVIEDFHAGVLRALDMSLVAVTQRNPSAAMQVIEMKARINELADSAALHEAKRLVAQEPNRLEAYRIEMDILEALKRIYYFCKRMARGVPTESE